MHTYIYLETIVILYIVVSIQFKVDTYTKRIKELRAKITKNCKGVV